MLFADASHRCRRSIALSGMYFSLQYLSLSDAVVLKFIVPTLTGFSGTIFLKESLSLKEVLTGCKSFFHDSYRECYLQGILVCSFFGVLLIARPQFLFGSPHANQADAATPGQRMLSITSATHRLTSHVSFSYHGIV